MTSKIQKRSIVTCILLSFITCGIYGIVWFINLTDDTRNVSGDQKLSGGKAFLFTILTCGIYGYYWSYVMGKALMQGRSNNGLAAEDNSILYLILQILGLGIVNYCLIQNELNNICDASNNNPGSAAPTQPMQPEQTNQQTPPTTM